MQDGVRDNEQWPALQPVELGTEGKAAAGCVKQACLQSSWTNHEVCDIVQKRARQQQVVSGRPAANCDGQNMKCAIS